MPRRALRLAAFFSIFILAASAQRSWAVIKVWAGGSGNFMTGANWSPSGIPQDGDDMMLIQADAINRTVTFNDTSGILKIYNSMVIDSQGAGLMTLQQTNLLTSLETQSLMIGNFGPATYNFTAGAATIGVATLNSGGSLNVGSEAFLDVTNFTQNPGSTVTRFSGDGHFNVFGTYRFNGGSFDGFVNVGSFVGSGAQFDGSVVINNTLQIPAVNFTFGSTVHTHSPFTLAAGRSITHTDFRQIGATFTQSGNMIVGGTGFGRTVVTAGATWNQLAGSNSSAGELQVGATEGGGTYTIVNGATLSTSQGMGVGYVGDGTFLQSGGRVTVNGGFGVRVGEEPRPSRMYWNMSGGTFTTASDFFVGYQDAISATFIQSNGAFQAARLTINDQSTTTATANISGGTFRVLQNSVNNGSLTVTGSGAVDLGAKVDGAGTVVVGGNGSLTVTRMRQNSLSISGNGRVIIISPTAGPPATTNRVKSLLIQETGPTVNGRFDLWINQLIVDYDGSSPLAAIKRYLKSGYAAGNWNGNGIISSAAPIVPQHNIALGYAESSQVFGPAGGVFGDMFADNSAVLIKYTWYGDTDLNGVVNFDDYARIDAGFNSGGNDWFHGDFNYDGVVNFDDYSLIDLAFNTQSGTLRQALLYLGGDEGRDMNRSLGAAVPEPASALTGLAVAGLAFSRRRHTKTRQI